MGAAVIQDGQFQEREALSAERGGDVAWEEAVEMGAAVMGMGEAIKMQRSHRLELSVPLVAGWPGRKSLYGEKIRTDAGGGAGHSTQLFC